MATIAEIRDIINVKTVEELDDASVQSAIDRATPYIADIATRCTASASLVAITTTNYAAFLAFQTYSGRVVHIYQGDYDDNGIRTPIVAERERSTAAQLSSFEKTYKENITEMKLCERSAGSSRSPKVHHRRQHLPSQFEHSDLRSGWVDERRHTWL